MTDAPPTQPPAGDVLFRSRRSVPGGRLGTALSDPKTFAALRRAVEETDGSLREIAERFDVPRSSFARWVRGIGWTRPDAAPKAGRAVATDPDDQRRVTSFAQVRTVRLRLLRAVDLQVTQIAARMAADKTAVDERDARALAALAKTLETLMALERDDKKTIKKTEPVDRGDIRAALERRIARWVAERGEPG